MQDVNSISSALKQKSFAVAVNIAIGLFLFLSVFLFSIQIVQKRNTIEDKIKIDKDLFVSSLKIGDLFFITKYISSFVDSKSTPFAGINDLGSGEPAKSPILQCQFRQPRHDFEYGLAHLGKEFLV